MVNKLGFFGFLGVLGFLGWHTGQAGYYGFFGFLVYFRYFFVVPDEMFRETVRSAASRGFFALVTAAGAGICAVVLAGRPDWTAPVFALAFAAAVIVFSVLMAAGELRENWGARG
ncbi:MAG: DUF3796 domain-containing protein [Clostridiaceae bacterium]|nr:DUF3796 domain-containing protein [Clostridiaceae bacterium]MCI9484657.1 DUF3796 domain-containing protein [Clostridiaceae bacterium]